MKYKTFFRIVLKLLGVYFAGVGICSFTAQIFNLLLTLSLRSQSGVSSQWIYYASILSPILQIALGLYLFFGGKWIIDKAIPSNRPYCHECGYDLTGAVGDVCNECGTPFRGPAIAKAHE